MVDETNLFKFAINYLEYTLLVSKISSEPLDQF